MQFALPKMIRTIPAICFSILATVAAAKYCNAEVFEAVVRASEADPKAKSYPDIGFVIEKDGKPADEQHARVDTSVASVDRLVIWLMAPNQELFKRVNKYGMHVIAPHYARQWFSICCQGEPVDPTCRGNMRLEAATGMDVSDQADIALRDSIRGRSLMLLRHLVGQQPRAGWEKFVSSDGKQIQWDRVILAGSSHGSTTAARFAKEQSVARVVMFCGPRDQYQNWQSLPSATPPQRYFGFSHVEDMGWKQDHYCRSWEMLGLNKFGPIINVDETKFPFQNSRRLVTSFDVGKDEKRAHGAVVPGKKAKKNDDGTSAHEDVWRYLFTHDVEVAGDAVAADPGCDKEQRP